MREVGVAEVEALERWEESTNDLARKAAPERKGDLEQASIVSFESAHKIQMLVRFEVLKE
jgi:hypothetical protein